MRSLASAADGDDGTDFDCTRQASEPAHEAEAVVVDLQLTELVRRVMATLTEEVAVYLSTHTVSLCRRVCREWNDWFMSTNVWRTIYLRDFWHQPLVKQREGMDWYIMYKHLVGAIQFDEQYNNAHLTFPRHNVIVKKCNSPDASLGVTFPINTDLAFVEFLTNFNDELWVGITDSAEAAAKVTGYDVIRNPHLWSYNNYRSGFAAGGTVFNLAYAGHGRWPQYYKTGARIGVLLNKAHPINTEGSTISKCMVWFWKDGILQGGLIIESPTPTQPPEVESNALTVATTAGGPELRFFAMTDVAADRITICSTPQFPLPNDFDISTLPTDLIPNLPGATADSCTDAFRRYEAERSHKNPEPHGDT
ncbi:hypothetical protein Pelo_1987 [Pelomyxa schiedti]|nr:hypothetical protein Pelo_1987 [Pelomyxa schiedti]